LMYCEPQASDDSAGLDADLQSTLDGVGFRNSSKSRTTVGGVVGLTNLK